MTAIPPIEPAPRAPHTEGRRQALEGWENEGGQTRPVAVPVLPEGITVRTEMQYLVGPYRYTDLGLARAELARQAADNARPLAPLQNKP
jgi:hypothetical protein